MTINAQALLTRFFVLVVVLAICSVFVYLKGDVLGLDHMQSRMWFIVAICASGLLISFAFATRRDRVVKATQSSLDRLGWRIDVPSAPSAAPTAITHLHRHLQHRHTWLERRRLPWLLVLGDEAGLARQFPGLVAQGWLLTAQAVLVWAGEGAVAPASGWSALRGRWRRPADGIVLVSDGATSHGAGLARLTQACGYALPVQVLLVPALPGERAAQAGPVQVSFRGGVRAGAGALRGLLAELVAPLAASGVAAMMQTRPAYFDAVLSQWIELRAEHIVRWADQLCAHLHRRQTLVGIAFAPASGVAGVQGEGSGPGAGRGAVDEQAGAGDAYRINGLFELPRAAALAADDSARALEGAEGDALPGAAGAAPGRATSPALAAPADQRNAPLASPAGLPHVWLRALRRARAGKLRWTRTDRVCAVLTVGVFGAALCLAVSYHVNRARTEQLRGVLAAQGAATSAQQAFAALGGLQDAIARLEHEASHGAPWRARFGLDQGPALREAAWPVYEQAVGHWLIARAHALLSAQLHALNTLPLDGTSAGGEAPADVDPGQAGYDTLKAWLMLARPARAREGAQADFLGTRLTQAGEQLWPQVPQGHIRPVAQFYAHHLAARPHWAQPADEDTLFAARQTLAGLIDLQQAEDTLYAQLLADARGRYADLTLSALLGGRDARALWQGPERLPGVFTRQAYEGYVREAIVQRARQTASHGDWVLGDAPEATAQAAAQATRQMQQRLTQRYFTDFAHAWQRYLNRLAWVPERTLAGAAEQLRLYADAQQSPLTALMRTLVWQSQTGAAERTLAGVLQEKARALLGRLEVPGAAGASDAAGSAAPGGNGGRVNGGGPALGHGEDAAGDEDDAPGAGPVNAPLLEAFAPLLRLAGPVEQVEGPGGAATGAEAGRAATGELSLLRYLERVSASRLKLDQVNAAADPPAFARQLAQDLYQGRASDLLDARDYAEQVAASLGSGFAGMGQNLFLRPLDQSWRMLMQPAAANLDTLWQASVLAPWNDAFGGRYPFDPAEADASLAELARFLGPQGLIHRFVRTQLAGLLEQQGDQWVPNPVYVQSLRFDLDFLNALNRLSWLSARLYAEGDARTRFELMSLGNPQLTESELLIDGQRLHDFNQKPRWERFVWPGAPEAARASLSWSTLATGLRQQDGFEGPWAMLRLLAQAHAEPVDRSQWRLTWTLADGQTLRYALRTQVGAGPLDLRQLVGLRLPARVFAPTRGPALPASLAVPPGASAPAPAA
ncbi:MAG: ImcF-related family protein [Candidatus Dactylopiibacterium sp.]|nr:ImcF-related family protein [Candidatus Dactylopiibacterium sp.]